MKPKHLVIGLGQVGRAVFEVLLESGKPVTGVDVAALEMTDLFDVIHCCIPYNQSFEHVLNNYISKYLMPNGLVIIHSTVPVGTSENLSAVHSPIRGVHPHLAVGIKTFTKFFGGPRAAEASTYFHDICPTQCTPLARNTEALKLWDTTYYGWNILFEKFVHKYCAKHGLDFDIVYRAANETYNAGYFELDKTNVQRPVLTHVAGPIGGHCVLPNAWLLDSVVADILLEYGNQQ